MINTLSLSVGYTFMIIGGTFLVIFLIATIASIVCFAWIHASNRFRDICKAESLIHEYRRNREKFLEWLEMEKKKEDCNGKA